MKSKNTAECWASLLQAEMKKKVKEPQGEGWLTFEQVTTELGTGPGKAPRFINQMIGEDRAETFVGTQLLSDGALARQVWYRLKGGAR